VAKADWYSGSILKLWICQFAERKARVSMGFCNDTEKLAKEIASPSPMALIKASFLDQMV
jgi:hypothetical protein